MGFLASMAESRQRMMSKPAELSFISISPTGKKVIRSLSISHGAQCCTMKTVGPRPSSSFKWRRATTAPVQSRSLLVTAPSPAVTESACCTNWNYSIIPIIASLSHHRNDPDFQRATQRRPAISGCWVGAPVASLRCRTLRPGEVSISLSEESLPEIPGAQRTTDV